MSVFVHRVHIDAAAMHGSQICNVVLSGTAYPSSYHSGLLSGLNVCIKEGTREAVIWQIMCFLQPFSSLATMRTSHPSGSGSTVKLAVKSVYHFATVLANWRNRATYAEGPPIKFFRIPTHVKVQSVQDSAFLKCTHMPHQQRKRPVVAFQTEDTTPATILSRASRQHVSSILQRLQDIRTGRWNIFSRQIQQLFTRYERNKTQAVPPTALQTRHLIT